MTLRAATRVHRLCTYFLLVIYHPASIPGHPQCTQPVSSLGHPLALVHEGIAYPHRRELGHLAHAQRSQLWRSGQWSGKCAAFGKKKENDDGVGGNRCSCSNDDKQKCAHCDMHECEDQGKM
ncbi:hypothetical protein B0H13DRAFT_2060091, partial [Mycena leptocephala]